MKCMVIAGIIVLISECYTKGLNEEFTWSRVSFVLPPKIEQEIASGAKRGLYIYENNVPVGINRWNNKLFVTVPRRRHGIPSTLNFIWSNSTQRHNVPLIPYPNYEINQLPTDGGPGVLTSVYRPAVDPCNRLWMVDTGIIEQPGNRSRVQQTAIVVIDLVTDQIIRRYELKNSDMVANTSLANIVVDVTPTTCNNAYAYIPDLSGYGLVVYSFEENNSWRISHNYFSAEALARDFNIGGVRFQWSDGIFSIALSDIKLDGFRNAYFHSMAGHNLYSVSTKILRDPILATRRFHYNDFNVELYKGQGSQTSGSDLHKTSGLMFFGLANQNALGCWNSFTPAVLENFDVVHKDDQKFIYPSDVKISGDDVIVLTNTMPVFVFGRLNYNNVNYRIFIKNLYQAVKDTKCALHLTY